jgi:hypothetical protein
MFGPSGRTLTVERHRRFEADRETIADLYPHLRHYVWAAVGGACGAVTGDAYAEGPIDVDVGAGCFEPVQIRMTFGARYPDAPPDVYESGGRWKPTIDRHIHRDHSFCLWLPGVDRPDVTSVDGFRQFLLRLLLFLRDQFVYDDLGHWPGLAWPHGAVDAYARHVAERLGVRDLATFRALWPLVLGATPQTDRGCPCGSPRSYDRCHRRDVETLLWLARHTDRADIAIAVEESLHAA